MTERIERIITDLDTQTATQFLSILCHELTVEMRFILDDQDNMNIEEIRRINQTIHRISGLITLLSETGFDGDKLEFYRDVIGETINVLPPLVFSRVVENFGSP